jgi:predicted metalloprotease with PDZ domain
VPTRYVVRIREPNAHRLEVEATFDTAGPTLEIAFPVWSPGSYLVREYERHVERMDAEAAGKPLAVQKVAKDRWRIPTGGAREVTARYVLYAHELSVRTNHVDPSHAFWTGAATYVYEVGRLDGPATLAVEAPPGWRVAVALDRDPESPDRWIAPDFDALVDAPVEVGTHELVESVAMGKPLAIAIWGQARFDRTAFVRDLVRIVEAEAAVFDGLPYDRYLFLVQLAVGARGGLEHMRSSVCGVSPHALETRTGMLEVLALFAHEHFHVWNVKRIRPGGLAPYRYGEENYTRLLWIAEGATAYYDWHALARAGIATRAEYYKHLAERIQQLEATPGRFVQSLEEASFDAWLKLYRADESTPNVTVSYYLKGEVVWAAIDLELRLRSGGRVSADDVMRRLWASQGPIAEDGAKALLEDVGGTSVADLYEKCVRGREDPDMGAILAKAGLVLERARKPGSASALVGMRTATVNGKLVVLGVERGGPAETAGLSPGDEVIAWEGMRVDEASLKDRILARAPGEEVRLTVFRAERLTSIAVVLGEAPPDEYRIVPDPEATPEARAVGEAWLAGAKE